MIAFHDVTKSYRVNGAKRVIVSDLSLALPKGRNIAVIGRNGAGKSTLLRMMSGTIRPDRGTIARSGRVSWPLGFSGGLHPALTGRQNARFVARVYGADTDRMVDYVEDFAELGAFLDMPFETYSTGMRARLAFGVSMAVEFDCYLVDEITAVGDKIFRQKCQDAFENKLADAQIIMVSHAEPTLRQYCDAALLLRDGGAWFFDDVDDGLKAYNEALKQA